MSDEVDYLDFEITVRKTGNDEYLLRAESASGQAEVTFTNPFNEDKRALIGATLTKVALRSSAKTRSSSAPEVKKMKEVGASLFEQAITGPVREFYYKCQGQADQQGKGIRWRLSLDPSLGDLPWEFLYLQDEFLALNPRSPVVRYIKGGARVAPLKAEHPLRVLVVIASPKDVPPLDTEAEKQRINAALQPLTAQGLVNVTYIEGPDTWERMIDALLPNRTHILHYIGHGAFDEKNSEGVLIMEDSDGMAVRIDSERLRVLVQGKSRLRLVVLNSCLGTQGDEGQPFSSMAAGLVRSGIPAVIAMQFEISDHAAQEIAETFYTSLALNMPVDAALTEARRKIFLSDRDSLEWATPILYMQVPDGKLFQFEGTAAPGPSPEPPPRPSRPESDSGESLRAKAAKRYKEGERAMAAKNWADAAKAFRGALMLVPDYQDASQRLSICEKQEKIRVLYEQSQAFCAEKKYYQALKALDEITSLDAAFVDTECVRTAAELGQKYNRALGELQNGNRTRAAELLREVVSVQPDFADAARRLDDLAEDGDGLLGGQSFVPRPIVGGSSQPQPVPTPGPPQPPKEEESREYEVSNIDLRPLAEEIRQYFFTNGHQSQILQDGNRLIIQGQKSGGWRTWVGMGLAATVTIEFDNKRAKVAVGGGKWIEQGAAMGVGIFLFPLLVTGGVGMAQQKDLIDRLWLMADNFMVQRGARRVR
jgi:tetratricopeptide (TPR) repeat protein